MTTCIHRRHAFACARYLLHSLAFLQCCTTSIHTSHPNNPLAAAPFLCSTKCHIDYTTADDGTAGSCTCEQRGGGTATCNPAMPPLLCSQQCGLRPRTLFVALPAKGNPRCRPAVASVSAQCVRRGVATHTPFWLAPTAHPVPRASTPVEVSLPALKFISISLAADIEQLSIASFVGASHGFE